MCLGYICFTIKFKSLLLCHTKDKTSLKLTKEKIWTAEDFSSAFGTDFVELYVGNAKQAAYYYMAAWGFQAFWLYAGLENWS